MNLKNKIIITKKIFSKKHVKTLINSEAYKTKHHKGTTHMKTEKKQTYS